MLETCGGFGYEFTVAGKTIIKRLHTCGFGDEFTVAGKQSYKL